jgi:hypothetical protein
MTQMLDLLPIPAERDLPAGAMELRRDALVAAIAADRAEARHLLHVALRAARSRAARVWLALLGVLVIAVALTLASFGGFQDRTATASEIVAVAGTAQAVTLLAAPTVRGGLFGNEFVLRGRVTPGRGVALPA